ncbi:MAG: hypothetical protein MJZ05_10370 [Fibrobacter sp.]|nr:hypothetical protein [Fibrobacter sp.]
MSNRLQIEPVNENTDLRKCGVGSLYSIKTEQAIRFYKKNDFVFADCDDELDIEQALNDGTFCDDKEMVVPMFFDLNSLKL